MKVLPLAVGFKGVEMTQLLTLEQFLELHHFCQFDDKRIAWLIEQKYYEWQWESKIANDIY